MKDCNLQILENEFVSIVGPSGCGKSTLLRMLAGLDFPTGGAIVIDDRSVTGPGKDRGMVFQTYTLFPWKTVEKNIRFGLQLNKVPKEEQNRVTEKYLGLIGLTEFRNSYPKELSGGMKPVSYTHLDVYKRQFLLHPLSESSLSMVRLSLAVSICSLLIVSVKSSGVTSNFSAIILVASTSFSFQ